RPFARPGRRPLLRRRRGQGGAQDPREGPGPGDPSPGGLDLRSRSGLPPQGEAMKTRTERSAGGVVSRPTEDGPEVVLASRRTRRGELAWGLAKGLVEKGEKPEE